MLLRGVSRQVKALPVGFSTGSTACCSASNCNRPGQREDITNRPGQWEDITNRPGQREDITNRPGQREDITNRPGQREDITNRPGQGGTWERGGERGRGVREQLEYLRGSCGNIYIG
jgi:hypothetical protein